ncbi:MAG: metallophosphoesterase [Nanoarchaeota archaeon]|nr:metallophosphoesterase [Nanoarchaeota archaeon]MBU1644119.1 metallophosphoesterase [Nanoarchaeota archaeon]MBU1977330.1 metallophosphoesterase [Nanoarchaeota archaeon]
MKILALSDIHGDVNFMKEMAEKGAKEKVDLVILAGDLFTFDNHKAGLIKPFKEKGLEVAVIPGNHEGLAEINSMVENYGVKNLHGYALKFGDIGIFGCGYGDVGLHQLGEKDFFNTLKKAHDSLKDVKKKLMVTHVQPNDSILGLGLFPGSSGVRKAIEDFQPDVHICGHVHETEGIEEVIGGTRVFNVGKRGKIIEL